jgi:uncharacterized protein YbaP (TraB family)
MKFNVNEILHKNTNSMISPFRSAMHSIFRIRLLALLPVLIFLFSCAGPKKIRYKPLENSLLWEIKGKDLPASSYVFGTIHLIPEADYFWTKPMENAFSKSQEVVFELDMNEMNDMSKMMALLPHLFMKGDTTLSMLLVKADYDKLAAKMQNMGLPLFLFERMKPFFLTVFLSEDLQPSDDKSMKSYELELTAKANAMRKTVTGLETVAFQASIFDRIPYKKQADMLTEMLKEEGNSETESPDLKAMISHYKNQEIQRLGDAVTAGNGEMMGMEEDLLFLRNEKWIPLMEEKMKRNSVFFAVGAGHLPGERGVIHLLRKAGYKVKAVKK